MLSQAFGLSHESYSTVRSNFGLRRDHDFFQKRRGRQVERLLNQIQSQRTDGSLQ